MKKTIMAGLFMAVAVFSAAVDTGGEVKTTASVNNLGSFIETTGKLELKLKGDSFYSQITLKGTSGMSETVEVDRAYGEIYPGNITLSAGKQRIAWGVGYLFNYADVFNEANVNDPKGDKKGINSIAAKLNIGTTGKVETIAVINDENKPDIGIRGSFTAGNFEFMGNYIKLKPAAENKALKQALPMFQNLSLESQYFVGEVRGELEIGIWSQMVYRVNERKNIIGPALAQIPEKELFFSAGADYTIPLGDTNSIYILGEYSQNDDRKTKSAYGMYRFKVSDDTNLQQYILADIEKQAYITGVTANYTYSDYVTLSGGYVKYIDAEKSKFIEQSAGGVIDEANMSIKVNF